MRNGKSFFVYLWQIRRKLFSWYVGEKHVGFDKRRQASQKEHVLSLKRLCQLKLSTRSFAGLIPDSRSVFNFPSTFACSLIAVFSVLVRFFRFFELVHGHFHGLGLFIPKIITPRKMLAWWLINWVASSNPAKVVSVDCITSLPDFIPWGSGYESVYYGINNTIPIYSERAHRPLQNPQVSC